MFLLLPLILAVLYTFSWVKSTIFEEDSSFTVQGIEQDISVTVDEFGVPSIDANSDSDAFFAMGFLHAKDRMWQMEVQRRMGKGETAEIFGRSSLSQDIWMRTLGLHAVAEASWENYDDDFKAAMVAFSAGYNAWLAQTDELPVEFSLFNVEPKPWTPVDSIVIGKLFSLMLSFNLSRELDAVRAMSLLPEQHFRALYPDIPQAHISTSLAEQTTLDIESNYAQLQAQRFGKQKDLGSNGWVVSGEHTTNGVPILANDPHLGIELPSMWYAAKIKGDKINSAGMTFPGLPFVIFGKNEDIAWGGANFTIDKQDVVLHEFNPNSPNQYASSTGWKPLDIEVQQIHIKSEFPDALRTKQPPYELFIARTESGPILDYVPGSLNGMSLKWTALDATDLSLKALLQLNYAKDWHSFRSALSHLVSPSLNVFYADRAGNIGMSASGLIPIRKVGQGKVPVPNTQFAWTGYVPWEEMPYIYNPPEGFIANANENYLPTSYPYFVGSDWAEPTRANRIKRILKKRIDNGQKVDAEFNRVMQLDVVDDNVRHLQRILIEQYGFNPEQAIRKGFLAWDGDMSSDSPYPALYVSFIEHLREELVRPHFKLAGTGSVLDDRVSSLVSRVETGTLLRLLEEEPYWCIKQSAQQQQTCIAVINSAFDKAQAELTKLVGSNPDNWRWSEIVSREYTHRPLGDMEALKSSFKTYISGDGTPHTINVANYRFDEDDGYIQNAGATFRHVFELTPDISYHFINSTGQSGHIYSAHYADMMPMMHTNTLIKSTESKSQYTLNLRPAE
ncbi:penicillin acylase family protein [Pseudoalteromonas sp. Of7M-16]|uniref:penicillin acylase family protein n=1 Tax=Pseudoalteromonas sp. Of7M-16 TaxID=2917756 RepID=UPI001EF5B4A0|nr:penicillin acylase family protein [Pseudoalteromonas sp. Of7M-16]